MIDNGGMPLCARVHRLQDVRHVEFMSDSHHNRVTCAGITESLFSRKLTGQIVLQMEEEEHNGR